MRCPFCLSLINEEVSEEFVECSVCNSKFSENIILEFGQEVFGELN
jgi:hypothetical protein